MSHLVAPQEPGVTKLLQSRYFALGYASGVTHRPSKFLLDGCRVARLSPHARRCPHTPDARALGPPALPRRRARRRRAAARRARGPAAARLRRRRGRLDRSSAPPASLLERQAQGPRTIRAARSGSTSRGSLGRAWIVGGAILAVGLAGEREDGLIAAVLVAVAFTVYFALSSAPAHRRRGLRSEQGQEDPASPSSPSTSLHDHHRSSPSSAPSGRDNDEFQPQNEFKLDTLDRPPGPARHQQGRALRASSPAILTVVSMVYVANRMQARPNRMQTAVETIYAFVRDDITGGSMDDKMARKWFPFLCTLFLFIWFSNLIGYIPLPTNSHGDGQHRRPRGPRVRDLRRDGEHLDPARARARRVRLLQRRGHPRQGLHRLHQEPDPRGRQRPRGGRRCSSSSWSRTSCGCSRSPFDSSPTSSPAT